MDPDPLTPNLAFRQTQRGIRFRQHLAELVTLLNEAATDILTSPPADAESYLNSMSPADVEALFTRHAALCCGVNIAASTEGFATLADDRPFSKKAEDRSILVLQDETGWHFSPIPKPEPAVEQ